MLRARRPRVRKKSKNKSGNYCASLATSVKKVLIQVHPDLLISSMAKQIVIDYAMDAFSRVVDELYVLCGMKPRKRLADRDVQFAVGVKAVTRFANSKSEPKKMTKSARAGLQFPVTKVKRMVAQKFPSHPIEVKSAVFLAAVMEYMVAEVLELAGNAAKDLRVKRVSPRHLLLSIEGDQELSDFANRAISRGKCTIAYGSVIPHIHKSLIPKNSQH